MVKGLELSMRHDEDIREAIRSVYTVEDQPVVEIPLADLMEAKLIGHPDAHKTT